MAAGRHARGAILTLGICILLILFADAPRSGSALVTDAVFRRPNLEALLQQIRTRSDWKGEAEFVSWATGQITSFMKAERSLLDRGGPAAGLFRESGYLFSGTRFRRASIEKP